MQHLSTFNYTVVSVEIIILQWRYIMYMFSRCSFLNTVAQTEVLAAWVFIQQSDVFLDFFKGVSSFRGE